MLYVSGEESAAQVRLRAERIEAMATSLYLASETDLATVLGQIGQIRPTWWSSTRSRPSPAAEVEGSAGNVAQVREVAASLIQLAKSRGIAIMLVGHVTKDGSIAGPRVLEHLVDVWCSSRATGTRGCGWSALSRTVTAPPTRSAASTSPTSASSASRPQRAVPVQPRPIVPGTCVTVTLEGRRPLVTEVQALLAASVIPTPAADHQRPRQSRSR